VGWPGGGGESQVSGTTGKRSICPALGEKLERQLSEGPISERKNSGKQEARERGKNPIRREKKKKLLDYRAKATT